MENKLYQVKIKDHEFSNIVSAPNAKEAKKIGSNTEHTEGAEYTDIRVNVIKGGASWYQEEPEIHFSIKGKKVVKTMIDKGLVDWGVFISELESKKLIEIDTTITFDEAHYSGSFFGLSKEEQEELQNKVDYDLGNFDEICEVFGVDVSKITFKQACDLLNEEITLHDLKKMQLGEKQV